MEMDQGEANVCIWQDTNKEAEVPFKMIVDWNMEGEKHKKRERMKVLKYNYINPLFGMWVETKNILYTVVKLRWTLTWTGNLSIVNAIVLFCILCCF